MVSIRCVVRRNMIFVMSMAVTLLGTDAAGTVVQVGKDVTHFTEGDRVYTSRSLSGAYAEMSLCEERSVHKLPDLLTFEQGASIGTPYCTAYRALFQVKPLFTSPLIHYFYSLMGLHSPSSARWCKARRSCVDSWGEWVCRCCRRATCLECWSCGLWHRWNPGGL